MFFCVLICCVSQSMRHNLWAASTKGCCGHAECRNESHWDKDEALQARIYQGSHRLRRKRGKMNNTACFKLTEYGERIFQTSLWSNKKTYPTLSCMPKMYFFSQYARQNMGLLHQAVPSGKSDIYPWAAYNHFEDKNHSVYCKLNVAVFTANFHVLLQVSVSLQKRVE